MNNLVDNPILNDAYEEPPRYWHFERGKEPEVRNGRRPAQYVMAKRSREGGTAQILHEYIELETVNRIRDRVKRWRDSNYPNVTHVTRELLDYWSSPERERRLFFCQLEAVETVIWLTEALESEKVGIRVESPDLFTRWCLKMATASGKTVVMAMLIAWSLINKAVNPQDARFSNGVLIVSPNLTVKDRLQVLYPERESVDGRPSYYTEFDIVPSHLRPLMGRNTVLVTNWQQFELKDDTRKRGVVSRGVESDSAFCNRVLAGLSAKSNILVLNDEAHHAYRFYPKSERGELLGESLESDYSAKEEAERARVWIEGLDRIHKIRGIRRCIDLSATPYFMKGSGRTEGEPFDWIVSDFGLLDAIESGIVKVPQVPNWDNRERSEPKYLRLYQEVKDKLPRSEGEISKGERGGVLPAEVQGALATLATQWEEDFKAWQDAGRGVPPAMIVVCNNTATSSLLAKFISDGKVILELKNLDDEMRTFRIDSKLLRDAEIRVLNQTQQEAAQELREIVQAIGEPGKKGGNIRCVVSVGMLSEGWDAHNVTQILGLRAFSSPLLCEQVIGRALRRFNYDDLSMPETADVYGIPFEVLPIAKVAPAAGTKHVPTVVKSLSERRKQYEIFFPRVIGYICDVKYRIKVDIDSLPEVVVTPVEEPTQVGVTEAFRLREMPSAYHTREQFYKDHRISTAVFEIAARITDSLQNRMLFPQVLKVVQEYYQKKVVYKPGVDPREVCLEKYINMTFGNVASGIRSDDDIGGRFLPILDPYRPKGSTNGVLFHTTLPCMQTGKSHLSHAVCQSRVWERDIAVKLEQHEGVLSYARNYRLGFTIPYFFAGETHPYIPDFIVHLQREASSTLRLVLEVKGIEDNLARAKEAGALKWVDAVNNWGKLGRWQYAVVKDLTQLEGTLNQLTK